MIVFPRCLGNEGIAASKAHMACIEFTVSSVSYFLVSCRVFLIIEHVSDDCALTVVPMQVAIIRMILKRTATFAFMGLSCG